MNKEFIKSKNYRSYKLRKKFDSVLANLVYYIVYFLVIFSLMTIFLVKRGDIFGVSLSIGYILAGVGMMVFLFHMFVKFGTHIEVSHDINHKKDGNIFNYFSINNLEIIESAKQLCKKEGLEDINVSSIILSFGDVNIGRVMMLRCGLGFDETTKNNMITSLKNQSNATREKIKKQNDFFLTKCQENAVNKKHKNIEFSDMVLAVYESSAVFAHILRDYGITKEDLMNVLSWTEKMFIDSKKVYFWQKKYYSPGIGQDWASGNTPNLNMYSHDISSYIIDAHLEYQSKTRQELIEKMEDILSKEGRNNVLLVGDPGVGKTTLVNVLAQKIIRGEAYPNINYKHVVELDINLLLAGVGSKGELEARFLAIFNEAVYAGNIILFVKDIGQLIGNYLGEVGTVNAAEFLLPYLESGKINVVANISYDDFKNKMQANTSLESLFSKVEVKEMKKEEVLPSIENLISYIEVKHKILFTYQAVKELIELSSRYIHDELFPQKAVDLLSELGIKSEKENKKIIYIEDVNNFVSERIKMPVGEVREDEKEKLMNLEKVLHERVVGQDEAIAAIANALRRARAGLAGKKRPIGSFLFIGPTGVGKTETARALAEAYYGSEKNMIRFDMSEFQEVHTIDRLIGSKSGNQSIPGRLTQGVKNNPYTLVLFDEIEKANPNILNLLLQVLDEGRLTDASGRTIDFTSTIIICTSNAGSEKIREHIGDNLSSEAMGKIVFDEILKENIFRPEFVNRFDKVVFYKPLSQNEIIEIVKIMIGGLYKELSQKNIQLEITEGALEKLAQEGYDPMFGARPLRRLLQEKVENLIAKEMISGEVKEGGVIKIDENNV